MLRIGNPDGPCECLVVSTERHISRLIQVNLERQRYSVRVANDVVSAMGLISSTKFPLAILYDGLPLLDGLELLRAIRAKDQGEHTFVVLVSSRASDLKENVTDCQADRYVQIRDKPRFW